MQGTTQTDTGRAFMLSFHFSLSYFRIKSKQFVAFKLLDGFIPASTASSSAPIHKENLNPKELFSDHQEVL